MDQSGGITNQVIHDGGGEDYARAIAPALNGGYVVVGQTNSSGAGMQDVFVAKADVSGRISWTKTYGFLGNDLGYGVTSTNDGGFLFTGCSAAVGSADNDVYMIKTLANGGTNWYATFGGTGDDVGSSVMKTSDGGYLIAGYTDSFGAGGKDIYLLKTNADGNIAPSAFSKSTGTIRRFDKS
jgi:hypothetical protein